MSGIIAYANLPANLPAEAFDQLAVSGISVARAPDGVHVSNLNGATTFLAAYKGSAGELAYAKLQKQQALDDFFNAHFDLAAFIRGGTATGITAANVGTFLATITNNYRTLRASIAAASTVAVVNVINVNSGWPANP